MTERSHAAILVVDDQRATRALVRATLRELGYHDVSEAGDGEEALRLLSEKTVHLIVSDLEMPKLDGLGLLRAVRGASATKAIPFLLLTSRAEASLVTQAKELGISGFLVKPFALGPLRQKVEAALGHPR